MEQLSQVPVSIRKENALQQAFQSPRHQPLPAAKKKRKQLDLLPRNRRPLKPCHCRRLCSEKFVQETRNQINRDFWARDFQGRRAFFEKHIRILKCKPCHKSNRLRQNRVRRKYSISYSMPSEGDEREVICKRMFLSTLGLTCDAMVTRYVEKKMKSGIESSMNDGRGKGRPLTRWLVDTINKHIESYHPQISHYRYKHAQNDDTLMGPSL